MERKFDPLLTTLTIQIAVRETPSKWNKAKPGKAELQGEATLVIPSDLCFAG